ncbi:hypothetical protein MAR_000358 [Mya arenaria]|uniref:Uncharacterized protein n=1 Tax=Mya arenaria TaxID=6604 RepID=A0ABY7F924_MYAAR|nr:hypothetical protein MAR_000358 [Mya arenaria]
MLELTIQKTPLWKAFFIESKSPLRAASLMFRSKKAEFAAALEYIKPDVICGSESWLRGIQSGKDPDRNAIQTAEVFPNFLTNGLRKGRSSLFSVEENTGGLYISTKHSNGDARTGEASDAVRVYVPEPPWGERGAEQLQGEGSAGGERGVALRNDDA